MAASKVNGSAELVIMHGEFGSRLLSDFEAGEKCGIIGHGSKIVADHMLWPGSPGFLWHMCTHPLCDVEVFASTVTSNMKDWTSLCHYRAGITNAQLPNKEIDEPPELAMLVGESDRAGRRLLEGNQGNVSSPGPSVQDFHIRLAHRICAFFQKQGIVPRAVGSHV